MQRCSIESITTKYVKGYGFASFARKYRKRSLDTGINASKKIVHKVGEFLRNKITDAVTKSNDKKIVKSDENPRNIEEIIIPLEERDEILNKLRKVL